MAARNLYPAPACPKCGKKINRVKNTYYTTDGRIVRTRTCDFCEWKWWSVQYPETNIDPSKYCVHIPNFSKNSRKNIEIRPYV